MTGIIYCGDNRDVMDEYIPPESVDLVYLDPPFNSQRTYNMVYKDADSSALDEAFKDCWSWEEAAPSFTRLVEGTDAPRPLRNMLRALRDLLIESDADFLAYLSMMTPRLLAIRRAMKPTGSLYLHCDPTASHYLKLMLDAIFGSGRFETEIIWQRSTGKALSTRRLPNNHDVILVYRQGDEATWNADEMFLPYDEGNLDEKTARKYAHRDPDGRRYTLGDLTNPNPDRPNLTYEFLGHRKVWRWTRDRMHSAHQAGLVVQPSPGAVPRLKRYLDEQRGKPLGDVWTDIAPLNSQAVERTGYPTQKPVALLERIIKAASKPGDVVLDPFCGCGTTVEAAERLGRRWIGIDIAHKAVDVIEKRFARVGLEAPEVVWHPADRQAAEVLASRDKKQFEQWAIRAVHAARRRQRDRGIDGEAAFSHHGKSYHVLVSVKGGEKLNPAFVRDLRGTIEREKAELGVLVSLAKPTKEMRHEASCAGFLPESDDEGPIPRLQLLTVERMFERLAAKKEPIRAPGRNMTELPKKSVPAAGSQLGLDLLADLRKTRGARAANARGPGPVSTKPRAKARAAKRNAG